MTEVTVTGEFQSPADTIWAVVRDFCGVGQWLPGIARIEAANQNKRRHVHLPDGKLIIEDEVFRDEAAMTLSYIIVEGPMPFADYKATMTVLPKGSGCQVRWVGRFTPKGPEEKVAKLAEAIYGSGLKALKRFVEP